MRNTTRLVAAAWAAACALALAAGTASATRSIEIAPNRGAFSETTRALTLVAGANTITCEVSFGGVLTRTAVSKGAWGVLPEGVIAAATSSRVRGCTESGGGPANIRFLTEIVHLYNGWFGVLPSITRLALIKLRFSVLIEYASMSCLYEGRFEAEVFESAGGTELDTLEVARQNLNPIRGLGCPIVATVSGTFTLVPKWRVRLA